MARLIISLFLALFSWSFQIDPRYAWQILVSNPIENGKVAGARSPDRKPLINANSSTPDITLAGSPATACTSTPPLIALKDSAYSQFKQAANYETYCDSHIVGGIMYFTGMPTTVGEAESQAGDIARFLKEAASYKLTPVVICEPMHKGEVISFTAFNEGNYDAALRRLFEALKTNQISDAEMGLWTSFPEANTPAWNQPATNPKQISENITRFVTIQKSVFPDSKASVMLDSASYALPDTGWTTGERVSLLPYVKDIPPGLIDSFGLQGFPWISPANTPLIQDFNAGNFLPHHLAIEAADSLGTKQIWFNSGTFAAKHTASTATKRTITPETRSSILAGILGEVNTTKSQGYDVSFHLFAENKTATAEATDWSYDAANNMVFHDFATELDTLNIPLWLFAL